MLDPQYFDRLQLVMVIIIVYLTLTSQEKTSDAIRIMFFYAAAMLVLAFAAGLSWLMAATLATPAIMLAQYSVNARIYWNQTHPDDPVKSFRQILEETASEDDQTEND